MFTVEGQKIQDTQNMVAKLNSLPFSQCLHSITTVDCQPPPPPAACLSSSTATSSSPASNTPLSSDTHSLTFPFHFFSL
ncbi:hypothetical protein S83_060496 [Arachis hypogaea]